HPASRRAGQAAPASGDRPVPGGGGRGRRLLGPEPVHPPLQAPPRRHAGAVPLVRKNRLKAASLSKKPESDPLTIPHDQRVGAPVEPSGVGRSVGCATPSARRLFPLPNRSRFHAWSEKLQRLLGHGSRHFLFAALGTGGRSTKCAAAG